MHPIELALVVILTADPMSQASAEKYARAQWFEFELAPVKTKFSGDWVKFVKGKQLEEEQLAAEWRASKSDSSRHPRPPSAEQSRALRVVQTEFEQVAKAHPEELKALALKLLEAMKRGELEPFIDDCAMYSANAPNRRELTQKYFKEHEAAWRTIAKLADTAAGFRGDDLEFSSPSPETGMTGQVRISFGPKVPPPKNRSLYPERHQLELTWSGEVMPNANGPLSPVPASPRLRSRWRFSQVVLPYSQDADIGLQ